MRLATCGVTLIVRVPSIPRALIRQVPLPREARWLVNTRIVCQNAMSTNRVFTAALIRVLTASPTHLTLTPVHLTIAFTSLIVAFSTLMTDI